MPSGAIFRRHRDDGRRRLTAKIAARSKKMAKAVGNGTDGRLNDLAAALEPVPAQVAVLETTVHQLSAALGPVPAQLAALAATVDQLADENRALRAELAMTQRELVQIAWALVAALLGGIGAIIAALI
jgi:septal ring factor EnvC (AmiA/AmiB activator)